MTNPQVTSYSNDERLNAFPQYQEQGKGAPSQLPFNTVLEVLLYQARKRNKGIRIDWKERNKTVSICR